jgi:hypothetical protein
VPRVEEELDAVVMYLCLKGNLPLWSCAGVLKWIKPNLGEQSGQFN